MVVGVNAFAQDEPAPIPTLTVDAEVERRQVERVARVRAERDALRPGARSTRWPRTAESGGNTMPVIVDAVRARVTLGEICDVFRQVYGEYREQAVL